MFVNHGPEVQAAVARGQPIPQFAELIEREGCRFSYLFSTLMGGGRWGRGKEIVQYDSRDIGVAGREVQDM
jgi:hypothetical protein